MDKVQAELTEQVPAEDVSRKKNLFGLIFMLLRIVVGIVLCASVPLLDLEAPLSIAIMAAGGLIAGIDLLVGGIYSLLHEDYFNRNTLLLIIFIIAYIVGVGYEGSILLILTQVGLLLSDYVRKTAREHVIDLTGLEFETAHVLRGDQLLDCYLDEVSAGDEIMVHPGEYFPVDCIIIDGDSTVDARLIDGKSSEVTVSVGDRILAGMLNMSDDLHCEVTSEGNTTASDILTVLRKEEAVTMPLWVKFFQPIMMLFSIVVGVAIVLEGNVDAFEAVHRALAVVTLSSAIPAYAGIADIRFAARAGAASRGIVFASDTAFEAIGACGTAVFCAEGTLTSGHQHVVDIHSERLDDDTFLKVAAHAMAYSQTAAGEAILAAYGEDVTLELVQDFVEIPNCGVRTVFNGVRIVLGTQTLMSSWPEFEPVEVKVDQQVYYMIVGDQYAGYLVLSDPMKEYAENISATMQKQGVENLEFVTGYSEETAEDISKKAGILKYAYGRGADARLEYVEQVREGTENTMMYLYHQSFASEEHSAADLDIAVGGRTADLLSGKADVVIPGGRISAVCDGIAAAQKVVQLSKMSSSAVFAVKLILIALAAAGLITVWFAATFELLATLFVKVFSTGAFHEKPMNILKKS